MSFSRGVAPPDGLSVSEFFTLAGGGPAGSYALLRGLGQNANDSNNLAAAGSILVAWRKSCLCLLSLRLYTRLQSRICVSEVWHR
jgi:hypothetical protein